MLIDLGVLCAWIAMSAICAVGLGSLPGFGAGALSTGGADDEPAGEDLYPLTSPLAGASR